VTLFVRVPLSWSLFLIYFVGPAAIANAIKDMGAMTSLDLSRNGLGPKGAKHIAEGITVSSKYVVAAILAPFLCSSDHWLNCCCLLLHL
jgi:hypothetical protein